MPKKTKNPEKDAPAGVGAHEAAIFSSGEEDSFWDDDKVDAFDESAAMPRAELQRNRADLARERDTEVEAAEDGPPGLGDDEPPPEMDVDFSAPTTPEPGPVAMVQLPNQAEPVQDEPLGDEASEGTTAMGTLRDFGFDTQEINAAQLERAQLAPVAAPTIPVAAPTIEPPVVAEPAPTISVATPVARYELEGDTAARWKESVESLLREAGQVTDGAVVAQLLGTAGLIQFKRLGDWDAAADLFTRAAEAGLEDADVFKAHADVAASQGDAGQLRDLLLRRADKLSGPASSEALQDAALASRNQLGDLDEAQVLLKRSLEANDADWFGLRLLRETHHARQDWFQLCTVLEQMITITEGPRAAALVLERATILELHLDDAEAAQAAYAQARDLDPDSTPALLGLLRAAGEEPAALAAICGDEAARTEGSESAFWHARAARLCQSGGLDAETTADHFRHALATWPTDRALRHEQQAFLEGAELWAELADALGAEADAAPEGTRAFALYRQGQVRELHLADAEGALGSFRSALEDDPTAGPAAEAVTRMLSGTGKHSELLEILQASAASQPDPNIVVTLQYRMGEICEGPLDDSEGAAKHYESILDTAPRYLPALEGLERVYTSLRRWDRLAGVYEQRAILCEAPAGTALQLHRAGAVCEFRLEDHSRAADFYQRALDSVPDFPPSLDAYARVMTAQEDWAGLAAVLRSAAQVSDDPNEVVSLTYRSARVFADKVHAPEEAMACLTRCLELSPAFLPAISLLRELATQTGAWEQVAHLQQLEAGAAQDPAHRHWRLLAAADASRRVEGADPQAFIDQVLKEDPANLGARTLAAQAAVNRGDLPALVALHQAAAGQATDDATRTQLAIRIADLASGAGDTIGALQAITELTQSDGDARPLGALAVLAEGLGYWEEAQRVLKAQGGAEGDIARLHDTHNEDRDANLAAWEAAHAATPHLSHVLDGLERALSVTGDRDALAAVHSELAELEGTGAVGLVHHLLAGHLHEALGHMDAAAHHHGVVFDARPWRSKAFDALVRLASAAGEADTLHALFARLDEPAPLALAEALESTGDGSAAADVLLAEMDARSDAGAEDADLLPLLIRAERNLMDGERWPDCFAVLGRRHAVTLDEDERAAIEGKRRWILAEKLADTDEAWDFYRELHEANPEDAEILEALARIAGARGDETLAIQYLEGLSQVATDDPTRARYHRRVAEIQEQAGDGDAARTAYLAALDLCPEDGDALAGLKRIAEASEDWRGLVGVLSRECTMLKGDAQLVRYREIATIWEERIGEPGIAVDAWRKVLELAEADRVALEHLINLCRSQDDAAGLAAHGQLWLAHLVGAELAEFQTELGQAHLKDLHNEGQAITLLDAASQGPHATLLAAQTLEKIHATRGSWAEVTEAKLRQARILGDGEEATQIYVETARTQLQQLQDPGAAAATYQRVLGLVPDHAEALRFCGEHLYGAQDYEAAVEIFDRVAKLDEDRDLEDFDVRIESALTHFHCAEALRHLGRMDEACSRYEAALELNGNHLPSLEAVGPLYMDGESWPEAERVYRQVLQLTGGQGDPESVANTYTRLGRVELALGHAEKARKRFAKATQVRPNDIGALQGMAMLLFADEDWRALLDVYNKIIPAAERHEEVIEAYLTKGFVLDAKMGLPAKAAQHYLKSLRLDPKQPWALLRLAEISLRDDDWAEAASTADRGLFHDDAPSTVRSGLQLVKAIVHATSGEDEEANEAYASAIEGDSALAEALGDALPDASVMHAHLTQQLQAHP
jgi:tetratricopeptide (TPR) repeat protein